MVRPIAIFFVLLCIFAPIAQAQTQPVPPAEVEKTLNAAKAYLYKQLGKDNNWEQADTPKHANDNRTESGQWGGQSAIAIYALLAAGESHRDPRLASAIEWLKKADIRGTYAVAFRLLAYTKMPRNEEIRRLASADLKQIMARIKENGNAKGMFDYADGPGNGYSHSRSQYGVLAAWAATEMGLEVPTGFWQNMQQAWVRNQDPSGGWSYKHPKEDKHPVTPGMTAAGLATLYLSYDFTAPPPACNGNPTSPPIDKGLAWLAKNIDLYATTKKYDRDFPLPTLYAVERVGLASGLRYLGNSDWFHKGARYLQEVQRPDGSFPADYGGVTAQTSFGVLFLARGRAPIVMQKLEYNLTTGGNSVVGPWHQRPRDAHFVTRFVARETERELSWQIAKLSAPAADLQESQILYIAGNKALTFTPEEEQKLKTFVHSGGMILFNADCNEGAFTQSVTRLATKLFDAEFRELPQDSAIYTRQMYSPKEWRPMPRVLGLSNGVRELCILIPNDFARSWALNARAGERAAHFQLVANLFLYANDKSRARVKGESYLLTRDPKVKPSQKIHLARLQYAGNYDPEPGALPRLATHLYNTRGVDATITTIKLGENKLGADTHVAFLTGTARVTLTPQERDDLKKFINGGGTVVIDAAGGRDAFAAAMLNELKEILPDDAGKMNTLPAEHKVFTIAKLPEVDYRDAVRATGQSTKVSRLRGLDLNGKTRVFFSNEDLTHGLLGSPTDGIIGYDPAYTLPLVANIVEHAVAK